MAFREKFRSYLEKGNKKEPEIKLELSELRGEISINENIDGKAVTIGETIQEQKIEPSISQPLKDEPIAINEKKSLNL
jgi:hypothetical protein